MKYIVFDTETTHLDLNKSEIWQFSGQIIDFDNKTKNNFNYNFKTNIEISMEAREKCCILPETIQSYPEFDPKIILDTLDIYNKDIYYVGHNIKYDRDVVTSNLIRHGINIEGSNLLDDSRWIDTYRLAKRFYNSNIITDITGDNIISLRLSYLFHIFHLYNVDDKLNFHSADFDVEITWRLLKYICKDKNISITDYKTLVEQSNKPILLTIFNFGKYKGKSIIELYNMHTPESERYFNWLCQSDICDKDSIKFDPDMYYTLEQL